MKTTAKEAGPAAVESADPSPFASTGGLAFERGQGVVIMTPAPTIVDGLMVVRPSFAGPTVRALLHGFSGGTPVIHEQWAISRMNDDFAFGGVLGTLPMRPYGQRLPRWGPATDFGTVRFTELSEEASRLTSRQFFDTAVGPLSAARCDYVNARVTLADGWTPPPHPAPVPSSRLEWVYDFSGDGGNATTRCYVASMAEIAGAGNVPFSARYVGWQFWTDTAFNAKGLDAKVAQRFSARPGEFPNDPVDRDTWFQAIMDRLDPGNDVANHLKKMATFSVDVYSGQKLKDYIAGVGNGTIPFGPPP